MRFLVNQYFDEPGHRSRERTCSRFAAYNAGPIRITALRSEAAETRPRTRTSGSTMSSSWWREDVGAKPCST
jgi:hypothetical protein